MFRLWLKRACTAAFGIAFVVGWIQLSRLEPARETGIFSVDPPTPYIHYTPSGSPRGRVLVVHGLDVSKEVMWIVSTALADGGFETYSIDLPGHGDSPAGFNTALAQQAIRNVIAQIGDDTMVLGHSLGAGLLLDLAESQEFSTMILLAPPPLAIGRIQSERVLIATGEQDIPRIRDFMAIAADIGGPNVESWKLPWAGHAAPIRNPAFVRRVVDWLGGDGSRTRTLSRFLWIGVMFAGAIVLGIGLMPAKELRLDASLGAASLLIRYVIASAVALGALWLINPFVWLRFFATDYLIGFVFVAGLVLVGMWAVIDRPYSFGFPAVGAVYDRPHSILKALAAAAFVIGIIGFGVASNLLHMNLSQGRWWRFPIILLASLPLFAFDELVLRRTPKSTAFALITRGLFLASLLTGVLILNRENAFLVLILPLVVLFWIALWFAAGVVHRHTQDPWAAALFSAIVQGWAFAAWFVTI